MVSITCNKSSNGYIKDHIFDLRRNISAFFNNYGHITNLQSNHLEVGLIAQLGEHCTGIAEVMGLNPVQA